MRTKDLKISMSSDKLISFAKKSKKNKFLKKRSTRKPHSLRPFPASRLPRIHDIIILLVLAIPQCIIDRRPPHINTRYIKIPQLLKLLQLHLRRLTTIPIRSLDRIGLQIRRTRPRLYDRNLRRLGQGKERPTTLKMLGELALRREHLHRAGYGAVMRSAVRRLSVARRLLLLLLSLVLMQIQRKNRFARATTQFAGRLRGGATLAETNGPTLRGRTYRFEEKKLC